MDRLRFHLDENVNVAVAEGLRRRGIDVTLPADAGLRSADDAVHVAFARSEGRIIVTHDPDFLRLHREGVDHAGIAYCPIGSRSVGEMIRSLVLIAEVLSTEDMTCSVEFL